MTYQGPLSPETLDWLDNIIISPEEQPRIQKEENPIEEKLIKLNKYINPAEIRFYNLYESLLKKARIYYLERCSTETIPQEIDRLLHESIFQFVSNEEIICHEQNVE
jgi:hypothetical protein